MLATNVLFTYSGTMDGGLKRHTNQRVDVIRKLDPSECDEEAHPMYLIIFSDGYKGHAFFDELIGVDHEL